MARDTRWTRARTAVVVVVALVLAGGLFLAATRTQVSGHCLALETIGGLSDGFPAPATAIDRAVLLARVRPDQGARLQVGQEVTVPDTLAETATPARVVAVDGAVATIATESPPDGAVGMPTAASLKPGATGEVVIATLSIPKTQLEPTAALRPVPGRPGLVTALGYRAPEPPRVVALEVVHVVGPYAQARPADPATAVSVGADPEPPAGQGALLIPDRFCRTAGLWPPVLGRDITVQPAP